MKRLKKIPFSNALNATAISLAVAAMPAGIAHADTLTYPASQHQSTTSQQAPLPRRGVTMAAIEAQYGAPTRRHAPVPKEGNWPKPPIVRWDYPQFSVFFERDKVITAVRPGNPPAVTR